MYKSLTYFFERETFSSIEVLKNAFFMTLRVRNVFFKIFEIPSN